MAIRPKDAHTAMSEINVTPLVDVMLVLLIIFMVTTPLLESGIDVNLPDTSAGALPSTDDSQVVISITKDKTVFINKKQFRIGDLRKKLRAIFKNRKNN